MFLHVRCGRKNQKRELKRDKRNVGRTDVLKENEKIDGLIIEKDLFQG